MFSRNIRGRYKISMDVYIVLKKILYNMVGCFYGRICYINICNYYWKIILFIIEYGICSK